MTGHRIAGEDIAGQPAAGKPTAANAGTGQVTTGQPASGGAASARPGPGSGPPSPVPDGAIPPGPPAGQQTAHGASWQNWRLPLALVALILLGGTIIALLQPAAAPVGYLDPGNARPGGARALAAILTGRGHVVVRAATPDAAVKAAGAARSTLLITSPGLLSGTQLASLARVRADLVLVAPDRAVLAALAPAVTVGGHAPVRARRPGCALAAARLAGPAAMGGVLLRNAPPGTVACYPANGLPSLVSYPAGGRVVTILGTGTPLTNGALARIGNAALALNLLGGRPRVVWLVLAGGPGAAAGRPQPLTSLIPLPAYLVAGQLVIAALLTALWRARRLGALVAEPLPVVIRASETAEGHARLYQARRARGRAARALRAAAVRRMAGGLRLRPDDAPAAIVAALAERTGTGPAQIDALLFGDDPGDDAALVALASDLDVLEREVRAQ